MTNTKALDMMLRLYLTADSALNMVNAGHVPPPEALTSFFRVVLLTIHPLIQKAIEDDNIPEWEMDQRVNAILEQMEQIGKEAAAQAAAEKTKH